MNALSSGLSSMLPSLSVVTGMITPAILILAAGSLVSSTLVRIGRIVDQTRALIKRGEEMRRTGNIAALTLIDQQLTMLLRRGDLARNALMGFYVAIALFLLSSLAIALTLLLHSTFAWLGPAFVILGGVCLFTGAASLVVEVNLSGGSTRREVEWYRTGAFDTNDATAMQNLARAEASEIPPAPG
jgi:hypothetical protein